jgi:hypothetical protein
VFAQELAGFGIEQADVHIGPLHLHALATAVGFKRPAGDARRLVNVKSEIESAARWWAEPLDDSTLLRASH